MANFTAALIGGWVAKAKLFASQLNHLQEQLLKAPNFTDGSTHALMGDLIVADGGTATRSIDLKTSGQLGDGATHIWELAGILRVMDGGRIRLACLTLGLTGDVTLSNPSVQLYVVTSCDADGRLINLPVTNYSEGDFKVVLNCSAHTVDLYETVTPSGSIIKPGGGIGIAFFYGSRWYTGSANYA
jgi:hypothetical protein